MSVYNKDITQVFQVGYRCFLLMNVVENSTIHCIFLFHSSANKHGFRCRVLNIRASETHEVHVYFVKRSTVTFLLLYLFNNWLKLKAVRTPKREVFSNNWLISGFIINDFIMRTFFPFCGWLLSTS